MLAYRQRSDLIITYIFYILSVSLFPFALGPNNAILSQFSTGIIWILVLFTWILSLPRLFDSDAQDGTFDFLYLSNISFELFIFIKLINHWLIFSLPLIGLSLFTALVFQTTFVVLTAFSLTLLVGTLLLSTLGCLGASLVLGSQQAKLLTPLIIFPLCIPILIFSLSAVEMARMTQPYSFQLKILAIILLILLPLNCYVSAFSLKEYLKS
jgi:heme exporter protein B